MNNPALPELVAPPAWIRTMTVVPADRAIAVNSEAYTECEFEASPEVHAVQWSSQHNFGEIHKTAGPPAMFRNWDFMEYFFEAWRARRAAKLAADAEHLKTTLEQAQGLIDAHETSIATHDEQIAKARADLAEMAPADPTRSALENHVTMLEGFNAQAAASRDKLKKVVASLANNHTIANERAVQAAALKIDVGPA